MEQQLTPLWPGAGRTFASSSTPTRGSTMFLPPPPHLEHTAQSQPSEAASSAARLATCRSYTKLAPACDSSMSATKDDGAEVSPIGKTKMFLRAGQMADLDARRAEVLGKAARIIQRLMRAYIARKQFVLVRRSATHIQSFVRGTLVRNMYECMRRESAAMKIQKNVRRHKARESYLLLQAAVVTLQTGLRAMSARKEFRFRKETKTAIHIQPRWRCHSDYSHYKNLQGAALTYQCAWRQRLARSELRNLKMAARETGALKEAKDKLKKRVEELTWRLGLEKRLRTDLEEAKSQEITKLQETLNDTQLQVEEAKAMVVKEREAARKATEEAPPVIKETPVLEKINSLTTEVEQLKPMETFSQRIGSTTATTLEDDANSFSTCPFKANDIRSGDVCILRDLSVSALDKNAHSEFQPNKLVVGDVFTGADLCTTVFDNTLINHHSSFPPGSMGKLSYIVPVGQYSLQDPVLHLEFQGIKNESTLFQMRPVHMPKPVSSKIDVDTPHTGQVENSDERIICRVRKNHGDSPQGPAAKKGRTELQAGRTVIETSQRVDQGSLSHSSAAPAASPSHLIGAMNGILHKLFSDHSPSVVTVAHVTRGKAEYYTGFVLLSDPNYCLICTTGKQSGFNKSKNNAYYIYFGDRSEPASATELLIAPDQVFQILLVKPKDGEIYRQVSFSKDRVIHESVVTIGVMAGTKLHPQTKPIHELIGKLGSYYGIVTTPSCAALDLLGKPVDKSDVLFMLKCCSQDEIISLDKIDNKNPSSVNITSAPVFRLNGEVVGVIWSTDKCSDVKVGLHADELISCILGLFLPDDGCNWQECLKKVAIKNLAE